MVTNEHGVNTAWLVRAVFSSLGLLPLIGVAACSGQMESGAQDVHCDQPMKMATGLERCGAGGPVHRNASEECSMRDMSGIHAGCLSDADCAAGTACNCHETGGSCIPANCRTDADCGENLRCQILDSNTCSQRTFTCQTPQDTCESDADCKGTVLGGGGSPGFMVSQYCGSNGSGFSCMPAGCSIGRPFLVEDCERLAPVWERRDWRADVVELDVSRLSSDIRENAAQGWIAIARMEHASIAAFARFGLQLLQLGAPPSLVERNTAAMADETRHAKLAFAIASQLAGRALGPGPLSIDGSLEAVTLLDVLRLVFREGCVGETAAALEARQAADYARVPLLRETLLTIAEDETRHAQLAWQFVSWALTRDPQGVGVVLTAELERALAESPATVTEHSRTEALNQLGLVSDSQRTALRRLVLRDVVTPCVQQLLQPGAAEPAPCGKPGTGSGATGYLNKAETRPSCHWPVAES